MNNQNFCACKYYTKNSSDQNEEYAKISVRCYYHFAAIIAVQSIVIWPIIGQITMDFSSTLLKCTYD